MSPRTSSILPCAIALLALLAGSPARAADPAASSSPLVRDILARAARTAAPGATAPAPTAAPRFPGAMPLDALPTALSSLRGKAAHPAIAAGPTYRSSSPYAPGAAGKLPSGEGFLGDQYGAALTTLGDMFGDGVSDVVVGAPAAVGPSGATGEVEALYNAPGPSTTPQDLFGEQVGSFFGASVAGVGDVNGDGYPDLLVGAPYFNAAGHASAGRAYLYLGGPFGLQSPPAWTFSTGNTGDRVGYSVAWAGDVNNDGYDDWLVGAPGAATAYLFKGGPGALSSTPSWTYSGPLDAGYSVSTAGDVNGDGYADILVGAPSFSGSFANEGKVLLFLGHAVKPSIAADDSFMGGQAQADLGYSVAPAGDVNGDGYADFLMGGPYFDDTFANQGKVLIAYGGPLPSLFRTPDVLEGPTTNAYFGTSVATAGDINGDGYADVIVGAAGILNGTNQGDAYVYLGSQYGLLTDVHDTVASPTAGAFVGGSVGTMGDISGDGLSDYWAGAVGLPHGEVWVHFGQSFGPGNSEIVAAQGYAANALTGSSVAAADLNGDGYDDLIVGSYQYGAGDPSDGQVSIHFGGPKPFPSVGPFPFLGAAPDVTLEGEYGDYFGFSVANAGDVNGDGYQDFLVGSVFHSGAAVAEGQAQLFYGSPSGPTGGAPWTVEGNQVFGLCGYAVSGGGDLNGDGYDDVVVSTPQGDAGVTYQGLASVYYGSKFGLAHTPAVTLKGRQPNAFLGVGATIVGDINGDGFDDLIVGAMGDSVTLHGEGIAYVHYGSPTGIHAAPDDSIVGGVQNGAFGWSIYRIGDIDGDGYADVAIDAPMLTDTQSQEGELRIFFGSPGGLVQPATYAFAGGVTNEYFGQTGVSGGDVNGDGYSDLVIGDPNYDGGAPDGGALYVLEGGPPGFVALLVDELGYTNSGALGAATLGRADFDGDGFPDLVYTSPGATLLSPAEGATFVRFGNSVAIDQRNPNRPLAAWRADESAPVSPGLRSDATTAFRLHGRGRSAGGRAKMRLESEVKSGHTPFDFTGHAFSGWQATGAIVPNAGSSAAFDQSLGGLTAGTRYRWRSRWQSRNPLFPYTPWFGDAQRNASERHIVTAGGAGPVAVDPPPGEGAVALAPASPNPSTAEASLSFTLPREGAARLALYDLRGALVRTLFDGAARAGATRVSWDGRDASGRLAPAGAYFVRLSALGEEKLGKLVHIH